jgi:signal transduction histidine kinase
LQSLRNPLPYLRAGVFVQSDGGGLAALALEGADFVDWDTTLDTATPFGVSWQARIRTVGAGGLGPQPVLPTQPGASPPRPPGELWHAVLPLQMGDRLLGLVAIETAQPPEHDQVSAVADLVDRAALRLETALLFGEVRSIATSEERRRLAREIHDGIAQELASLGYAIDDLAADADDPASADVLRNLRRDVTRMVGELRLSIFDLRSEVQAQTGLGAALSNYVRAISAGAEFSVHVILDESPARLSINVEAELLRIAQEAVTNARKHAGAHHLWVSCQVDPPFAHLRIEDDGRGLGKARHDSFGLEVMRERAERIGASLAIGRREPHGTFVDVRLGERRSRPRDATVGAEHQGAGRPEEGTHDGHERAAR